MIRKNGIKINLIREKKSCRILHEEYIASFRPETETCPHCGARGNCQIHACYYRYIIDFVDGKSLVSQIRIPRVICSCGTTHAILFDPIIPYEQHSLFFILRVLAEFFRHFKTIARICSAYDISVSTFYRWMRLFKQHRREWLGSLKAIETDLLDSIHELVRKEPFSDFAVWFFRKTGVTFMQSHKNPAHSLRKKKTADHGFP